MRFALSLCYRYALHHLRISPHNANAAVNQQYRDLTRLALDNLGLVGNQVFVYPQVIRPVLKSCEFLNRVNSFLYLSVHGCVWNLPNGLPEVFIVRIPKVLYVFSRVDLVSSGDPRLANLVTLGPAQPFDPMTANPALLSLLAGYINQGIGETMAHQKALGWWKKFLIGWDKKRIHTRWSIKLPDGIAS